MTRTLVLPVLNKTQFNYCLVKEFSGISDIGKLVGMIDKLLTPKQLRTNSLVGRLSQFTSFMGNHDCFKQHALEHIPFH